MYVEEVYFEFPDILCSPGERDTFSQTWPTSFFFVHAVLTFVIWWKLSYNFKTFYEGDITQSKYFWTCAVLWQKKLVWPVWLLVTEEMDMREPYLEPLYDMFALKI